MVKVFQQTRSGLNVINRSAPAELNPGEDQPDGAPKRYLSTSTGDVLSRQQKILSVTAGALTALDGLLLTTAALAIMGHIKPNMFKPSTLRAITISAVALSAAWLLYAIVHNAHQLHQAKTQQNGSTPTTPLDTKHYLASCALLSLLSLVTALGVNTIICGAVGMAKPGIMPRPVAITLLCMGMLVMCAGVAVSIWHNLKNETREELGEQEIARGTQPSPAERVADSLGALIIMLGKAVATSNLSRHSSESSMISDYGILNRQTEQQSSANNVAAPNSEDANDNDANPRATLESTPQNGSTYDASKVNNDAHLASTSINDSNASLVDADSKQGNQAAKEGETLTGANTGINGVQDDNQITSRDNGSSQDLNSNLSRNNSASSTINGHESVDGLAQENDADINAVAESKQQNGSTSDATEVNTAASDSKNTDADNTILQTLTSQEAIGGDGTNNPIDTSVVIPADTSNKVTVFAVIEQNISHDKASDVADGTNQVADLINLHDKTADGIDTKSSIEDNVQGRSPSSHLANTTLIADNDMACTRCSL